MTYSDLTAFYENRKLSFSKTLQETQQQINIISNLRIGAAVALLVLIYIGVSNPTILFVTIPVIIGFVALIVRHTRLFEKKTHLENLVAVNKRELAALKGDYKSFSTGEEFIDPHHPYSHDLDIFGEGSLFQALNRCNTRDGKKRFAHALSTALPTKEEILQRQEAIRELSTHADFRQHFEAAGLEIDEHVRDREQLLEWIKQPSFLYGKSFFKIIFIILPALTIGCIVGSFFSSAFGTAAILLAITQWAILGLHVKKINAFHDYISRKKNILQKYARLLYYLQGEKFMSRKMQEIERMAKAADVKVKRLASLVNALDARTNVMMTFLVNSVLLYDLQCVYKLEQWKEENANELQRWLDAISETEVVSSFATFSFNHPEFIFADVNDALALEAKGLGHPLIPSNECITNDVAAGNGPSVLIITGANMAGKSTFLRTIGINVVLALNGAPVFASTFKCPIIALRTGMRTADSLKDHQSYFYAELNRLKSIVDQLRNQTRMLILLDEILKGTNSTDKQAGSIALVKQLIPYSCLALIATHDLALGDLEHEFPQQIKNFCFEPTIENDQLSFDYKLKPGLAQKMNATFLMKKMGIIPT